MAKEPKSNCSCVVDTSALHAIANASGNLSPALIAKLENGIIGVPSWAWQEFKKIYEDEAAALSPHINKRLQFNAKINVRAARIAEELNLGFSRGVYDNHVELFTASIAFNESYTVLTSTDNISAYANMGCDVQDLESWIAED
jgi:hypothetical protein